MELLLFIMIFAVEFTPDGSTVPTNHSKVGEGTLAGRGISFMTAEQVKEKISPGLG